MPQQPQVPRSSLTSRAAVLALVVCALVLMLAYPVQQYLAQRGQIAKLERANASAKQQVDALAAEDAQWGDHGYVERQARTRLHYVMPGETEYVLTGGIPAAASPAPVVATTPTAGTWYGKLWGTVRSADRTPAVKATPTPSTPTPAAPASAAPASAVPSATPSPSHS